MSPDVSSAKAVGVAALAKALFDPVRVQPEKAADAGIVGVERRRLWAYYYVHPEAVKELKQWLP